MQLPWSKSNIRHHSLSVPHEGGSTPQDKTSFSEDPYPLYRRRVDTAPGAPIMKTIKGGVNLSVNNAWVVPYNPYIAHINLEIVCAVTSVKYLYNILKRDQISAWSDWTYLMEKRENPCNMMK